MAESEIKIESPFPGLRPFKAGENHLFFGREGQTEALIQRLRRNRFLAVVGTSGSGKSSLVRAGLLHALHGGLMADAGSHWRIALMRPGDRPIGSLARALNDDEVFGGAEDEYQAMMTEITLQRSAQGLIQAVKLAPRPEWDNLLVVVDQFEELFRFQRLRQEQNEEAARDEAAAFVKLLLEAAKQTELGIYVVITMRSDFLGDCAQFRDLPEAINASQYLIPRMTRDQRRSAIASPVAVADEKISPAMVQLLLNDVGDDPDQLPVLQHAMMRTWDHWRTHHEDGEPLDVRHYEAVGRMADALSRHADEAFSELKEGVSEEEGTRRQLLAERLFRAVTERGPDNREVRRPMLLRDICAIADTGEAEMISIIDVFRRPGRSFLMPPAGQDLDSDSRIDISHESLIRQWKRLQGWVDTEANDVEMYRRFANAAEREKTGIGGLLSETDENVAREWWDEANITEGWAVFQKPELTKSETLAFLDKSRQKHEAVRQREQERREQELRLTRRFLVVTVFALLVTIGLSLFALSQWRESVRQREEAQYNLARVSEEKATNAWDDGNPEHAWLYSLAALHQDFAAKYTLPITYGRLLQPDWIHRAFRSFWNSPIGHQEDVLSVAFSHDGQTIASGSADKTIRLWNVQSGANTATLEGHRGYVWSVAFSPDGQTIASGSEDGTIRLWNTQSGETISTLQGHQTPILSVAFSPDGQTIASGSEDHTIRLWNAQSGEPIATFVGHQGSVFSVAFSPDGQTIASGSEDHTIRLRNAQSGEPIAAFVGHQGSVFSVAFSPDGRTIASGSEDHTIQLWNAQSGEAIATLQGHQADVMSVAFSPDQTIASGSADKTIRLWDAQSGETIDSLEGHRSFVLSVAFTPDGQTIASGSSDDTIRLWNTQSRANTTTLEGHRGSVTSVAFSHDGQTIASGSADNIIRLWNARSGETIDTLEGQGLVWSVAFSPDEQTIASGSSGNNIRLWNAQSGETIDILPGHQRSVVSVAFSPDGQTIASGSEDDTIRLWNVQSGANTATLEGHRGDVSSVAFSPDGQTIASGSEDHTIRLWNAQSGANTATLEGHRGYVSSVAFSPDGQTIASGSEDHTIRLWNAQSGEPIATLVGHQGSVFSVAFSLDGRTIASGSSDNTIRLWNVQSGANIATLEGHRGYVWSAAFSHDGQTIASGSSDNTIRLWPYRVYRNPDGTLTEIFEKLYTASMRALSYRLDGIELVPEPRMNLAPLNGNEFPEPQSRFHRPRPAGVDVMEWLLGNVE